MTLLFIDGFDHYQTADLSKRYTYLNTQAAINTSNGRRGGGCFQAGGTVSQHISKVFPASASWVIGAAIYMPLMPNTEQRIFGFYDAGTFQCSLRVSSNGVLQIYRFSTLVGSSVATLAGAAWHYVEWKLTISNSISANSCIVRVNGVEVLNLAAGSNIRNSANNQAEHITLAHDTTGAASSGFRMDDLYICNQSGATNNDFLGDVRVDRLLPDGDGTYTDLVHNTGSSRWEAVDETLVNGSDWVASSTNGHRGTFSMSNLAALSNQTIFGIQANAAALKTDAGTRNMAVMVRSGSTDSEGPSSGLSVSQLFLSQIYETNPNTGTAWTESTVNAMEAGVKVTA